MKIIAGVGVSTCLAVLLAGCGNKESEICPAPAVQVYCPPVAPIRNIKPSEAALRETSARVLPATPAAQRPERPVRPLIETITPIDPVIDPVAEDDSHEEAPAPLLGEGTADWAVPLEEENAKTPEEFAEEILPETIDEEIVAATIDFPDENLAPDDFGLPPEPEPASEPEAPAISEPEPVALTLPEPEPEPEPAESLEPPLLKVEEPELTSFPDEDDFEFFGSLSESFFNELAEGES